MMIKKVDFFITVNISNDLYIGIIFEFCLYLLIMYSNSTLLLPNF